ncbi:MAG: regulatory protein RecX [Patescibacteria group bacterium]|jgi:regulatory protein
MENTNNKPKEYALRLIKIRDRSTGEIRAKMRQKGFCDDEIESVVSWLNERSFLDDKKFVAQYIKNQLAFKPQGKFSLRMRLKKLHVADDLVDEALSSLSASTERGLAREAASKWMERKKIDPAEAFEKLGRYLTSRGFGWDITKSVLDEVLGSK